MHRNNILLILTISTLFIIGNIVGTEYFSRREINTIVQKILTNWLDNNLLATIDYWYTPKDSPPIDNLIQYHIISQSYDKAILHRRATYIVDLTFKPGTPFVISGKWLFECEKTTIGWKIMRCMPVDGKN